jgi:predicted metal-dependent phosphoesterase TrpH
VSLVDLHIHSNASDGKYSPGDIVRRAFSLGLRVISISDHDTVDGIAEALTVAAELRGFTFIPGVEISTDVPQGEVHVLGYFINHRDSRFLSNLNRMKSSRVDRARKIIAKLSGLGIDIEWPRVREIAGDSTIGRPHIAQAMLEKGCISNLHEAFERYIGHGGPAYVERDKMTPAEAVKLIVDDGGLPVFAHPVTFDGYEKMTAELLPLGLAGLEVYYKNSTAEDIRKTGTLALKFGLIPTGGSDFHGIEAGEVDIGGVEVPFSSAERLIAAGKKRAGEG